MVKDQSDCERRNPLAPLHGFFYMHHPIDRITHGLRYWSSESFDEFVQVATSHSRVPTGKRTVAQSLLQLLHIILSKSSGAGGLATLSD